MTKIFRRETLVCGTNEKKPENRKRDVIINFRVSPEEKRLIDARIEMIGLPKASFLIQSCLYQAVLVKGNIKTFDKINAKMQEIYEALNGRPDLENIDGELLESWITILQILERLYGR